MKRPPIVRTAVACMALLLWTASAHPQRLGRESARTTPIDRFALIFAPGPMSGALIGADTADETGAVSEPSAAAGLAALLESIRQAEAAIADEETLNGPSSPGLIEPLVTLAELYRQIGEVPLTIAAYDRARQLIRARDGLFTLAQRGLIETTTDFLEEAGAYYESDVLQAETLELAARNADDPQAPSMLTTVADRQMEAARDYVETGVWERSLEEVYAPGSGWALDNAEFLRTFAGRKSMNRLDDAIRDVLNSEDYEIGDTADARELLAETYALIDIVNDHNEAGQVGIVESGLIFDTSEIERDMALSAFKRARRLYSDALQQMLESGDFNSGEFLALEQKLIDSYWFELEHAELYPPRSGAPALSNPRLLIYGTGTSTLEARVVHLISRGSPAVEIANALIALGDWHLLFSENRLALETYRQADDLLARGDVPAATRAGIVSPETPAMLAQLTYDPSAEFDPARIYSGFVDLAIETGRFGQVREAEIVGSSEGTPPEVEKRARTHAFETRFRPRFVDGEPLRSDRFALRYHYDERFQGLAADD